MNQTKLLLHFAVTVLFHLTAFLISGPNPLVFLKGMYLLQDRLVIFNF